MSTVEWKPGDVALIRIPRSSAPGEALESFGLCEIAAVADGRGGWIALRDTDYYWPADYGYIEGARPLVVIDPASLARPRDGGEPDYDAADLADTLRLLCQEDGDTYRAQIVLELADVIDPPPKCEEPTGLGAVVEDEQGRRWVRIDRDGTPWAHGINHPQRWCDLTVARVISEGEQL